MPKTLQKVIDFTVGCAIRYQKKQWEVKNINVSLHYTVKTVFKN